MRPLGPPICRNAASRPSARRRTSADRHAEGHLEDPGAAHVARDAEQLGACALGGAELRERRRPHLEDPGDAGEGLHVVDDGRAAEVAALGWEGRAVPRVAPLPLAGAEQRRFLAADVGPGAHLDADVEVEGVARQDVGAQQPVAAAPGQHVLEKAPKVGVFSPEVEDALPGPDGVAGDRHPREHTVGKLGQEDPILERAGLALRRRCRRRTCADPPRLAPSPT